MEQSRDIAAWQDWLYTRLQAYERIGRKALHPTLTYMERWDALLGHPHRAYPIIHVAGTNGKGSTSAFLASILQAAGYKVGLHMSPHLHFFTERMRVNGKEPPSQWVDDFLSYWEKKIEELDLSFFEATVGMSFAFFREAQVDVAVVEVGLGGKWDATNIVIPELALITPIGWDHVEILGPTLTDIAYQKAGIIKEQRPVIIAPSQPEEAVHVFSEVALARQAPLYDAQSHYPIAVQGWHFLPGALRREFLSSRENQIWLSPLTGDYQASNLSTVRTAVEVLREKGWTISDRAIQTGIAQVQLHTGLRGRAEWLRVKEKWILLDVAHNPPAFAALRELLRAAPLSLQGLLLGFSQEKDILSSLKALGGWEGPVFFTQANLRRALPAEKLRDIALDLGYKGEAFSTVSAALEAALDRCESLLITGSVFIVSEALSTLRASP
ncbi:MAG: Mur ligase family protein [Bacteroidia bacterium]|nr:Mur ligase family protein [Bacteroidia bacterium]